MHTHQIHLFPLKLALSHVKTNWQHSPYLHTHWLLVASLNTGKEAMWQAQSQQQPMVLVTVWERANSVWVCQLQHPVNGWIWRAWEAWNTTNITTTATILRWYIRNSTLKIIFRIVTKQWISDICAQTHEKSTSAGYSENTFHCLLAHVMTCSSD